MNELETPVDSVCLGASCRFAWPCPRRANPEGGRRKAACLVREPALHSSPGCKALCHEVSKEALPKGEVVHHRQKRLKECLLYRSKTGSMPERNLPVLLGLRSSDDFIITTGSDFRLHLYEVMQLNRAWTMYCVCLHAMVLTKWVVERSMV